MIEQPFIQLLLLLSSSAAVVAVFQKLHIPSSIGYLLVGVVYGSNTPGPVIEAEQIQAAAEFGIVFLLFTIGLSFSLPQIHALRGQVLGLGTGQVVLTTAVIGVASWLLDLPPAAAFVVGAVFAQSSTTEENYVDELRQAGATEVVPELLEAGLMIAAHALLLLNVPLIRVVRRMQQQLADRYPLLRELYRGQEMLMDDSNLLMADSFALRVDSIGYSCDRKKIIRTVLKRRDGFISCQARPPNGGTTRYRYD